MRKLPLCASLSVLALLAACGSNDGYYDANGNWVPPANATTEAQRTHAPDPGMTRNDYRQDYADHHVVKTVTTYSYDRPGYYDYNGYYIAENSGMVPEDMFPPRGMCRVWFPGRAADAQPAVESCDGIRARVPAGAYVIYGG